MSTALRRSLAFLFLSLAAACSGDGDALEVAFVTGPIRGAPLDPGTPPAAPAAAAPLPPATAPESGAGAAPSAAAPAPAATPALTASGENPAHGVKAVVPADLPAGLRYLTYADVAWPDYQPPELRDAAEEQLPLSAFPEPIQALNGVRVAFDGYMVPLDFAERKVTSFILSRYLPGCCFGAMPRLDEWIEVEVTVPGGIDYVPFQIVRVTGPFAVGEVLDDYGYVRSIYRMKAEAVEDQH